MNIDFYEYRILRSTVNMFVAGLVFVLVWLCPQILRAQLADDTNAHVIVSFDLKLMRSEFNVYRDTHLSKILGEVTEMVRQSGHKQFTQNDYVSVLTYAARVGYFDAEQYVKPWRTRAGNFSTWISVNNPNNPFSEIKNGALSLNLLAGYNASFQTGSRMYSLKKLFVSDRDTTKLTNKVFLAVVTDNYYNGADNYAKEYNSLGFQKKERPEVMNFFGTAAKVRG